MTPAGTLLVPHLGEGKVVEYTLEGKVLWSVEAKSPWSAVRLKNGNTLIAGDWSGYVREVNPKGETVWELTQKDVSGFQTLQPPNRRPPGKWQHRHLQLVCRQSQDRRMGGYGTGVRSDPREEDRMGFVFMVGPGSRPSSSIQLLDEPGVVENNELQR